MPLALAYSKPTLSPACQRQLEVLRQENEARAHPAAPVLPYERYVEMSRTMYFGSAKVFGHLLAAAAGLGIAWMPVAARPLLACRTPDWFRWY